MRNISIPVALLFTLACQSAPPPADTAVDTPPPGPAPGTPEWKIQNALSAGPAALTGQAAVMDLPATADGPMVELRAGTNGWTCMPDVPATPGVDPMCLDGAFAAWAAAWKGHTTHALTGVGVAYMLAGGSDASNTDPYATEPNPQVGWIESGPHIMIVVPDVKRLAGMSTDYASGGPYVMWQGTPYAHIMIPVR